MSRSKVKVLRANYHEIMAGPGAKAMIERKAEAITDACNRESSWGGYLHDDASSAIRARQHIWSADARNDEARDQRLVRNLDAGAHT